MRIEVKGEGHHIHIPIPNWVLFSRLGMKFGLRMLRSTGGFWENLSDRDAQRLFDEMHRMVKKYGHWELIHVESADGELVSIIV